MLAKRIIPCLDVDGATTVKGRNFEQLRAAGDPLQLARRYSQQGADELVVLDIAATLEERRSRRSLIERISAEINIPLCVGGGVKGVQDASELLESGADKVAINSAALSAPGIISALAEHYGQQCVVVAIDATSNGSGDWRVMSRAGKVDSGRTLRQWLPEAIARGAGEILLTSIDRDGTASGFDLEMLRVAAQLTQVPLIASGGAGRPEHFAQALAAGMADAALAASVFHFGTIEIHPLKQLLAANGIPVRL